MQILSKGYRIPEIDDTDFWDSYNYDIQRLNDHTHDGTNSQHLAPGAILPFAEPILVADWLGAGPFYYDLIFPLVWNMVWNDGDPCPVHITARNVDENIVYFEQGREPLGLGVRLFTMVKMDAVLGVI